MSQEKYGRSDNKSAVMKTTPSAQELKGLIDSGRTHDKVSFPDQGAAPLGTDDEAAGTTDTPARVTLAIREEINNSRADSETCTGPVHESHCLALRGKSARPLSPNIQIYRPQLTSVLSIVNRITGIFLSIGAVGMVVWLIAAATGPELFAAVQGTITSWIGQTVLIGFTFAFFLHLCGGIRHLVWDAGYGFELRSIYVSGWLVVTTSVVLTMAAWIASLFMAT
jgi:succinate dehydrogenase / fumarate reductase cytochrome b subunit